MKEEPTKLSINITPGSVFKGILIILLFWFLFFIKDVVLVVLMAVVIASALEPFIEWFKKFKIKRLPAAIISYVFIFSVFTGLMFSFVPAVLDEASSFLSTLPKYLNSTTLWNPLNVNTEDLTASQKVVQNLSEGINNPSQLVQDISESQMKNVPISGFGLGDLVNVIQNITSNITDGFVKILSTVFGGLLSFVLIVILSFYLIVQEDGVAKFLGLITPIQHEKYVINLWKRSQRKIGQWMQGQLLLGVLVGILIYLGLVILGVKNALLFAVFAALLEIIPIFGPVLSSIPPIIAAFLDGGVTSSLLVVGLYVIVQQFESNLIYPLVVRKVVGVSPIIVILALIVGAKLAGFLGIILSVPIVTAAIEFLEDVEKKKYILLKKTEEPEKA